MAIKSNKKTSVRGARRVQIDLGDQSREWLRQHKMVAREALERLKGSPISTAMTVAVLAIALALPGFLFTVLKNVENFSTGLDAAPRIMLYLKTDIADSTAEQMSLELMHNDKLTGVELINREQGFKEFSSYSEFASMIPLLDINPLPPVIIVYPSDSQADSLQALQVELQTLAEVSEAVMDLEWIHRLNAYVSTAQRFSWVLSWLLGLTVLLVVGNTIRMTLESRRDEIIVAKLVGASDAWVRRPFVYTGFWYGLIGSLVAFVLIQVSLIIVTGPARQLASLYVSSFSLQGMGFFSSIRLFAIGTGLGVLGGFLSTGKHLKEIEPS